MPVKTIILIALCIAVVSLLILLVVLIAKKKKASAGAGNISFSDQPSSNKPKRGPKAAKEPKGPKKGPKGPKKGKRNEEEANEEEDIFMQFANMQTATTEGGEEEEVDQVNIHSKYSNSERDERAIAKDLLQKLFDGIAINSTTKLLASVTEPAIVDFVNAVYTIQTNDMKRQFKAVNIGEPKVVSKQPSGRDELITIEVPVEYKDFLLISDGRLVGSRDKVFKKDLRLVLKKNMDSNSPVLICNINL